VQAGGAGGPDAVLSAGTLTVPSSSSAIAVFMSVGGEAGQAHAVDVSDAQLDAGVRAFGADGSAAFLSARLFRQSP
jgi:hypothetical protein